MKEFCFLKTSATAVSSSRMTRRGWMQIATEDSVAFCNRLFVTAASTQPSSSLPSPVVEVPPSPPDRQVPEWPYVTR